MLESFMYIALLVQMVRVSVVRHAAFSPAPSQHMCSLAEIISRRTKVIEDEAAISSNSDVAWVWVRVQEAMLQDLHKVGLCGSASHQGGVNAGGA